MHIPRYGTCTYLGLLHVRRYMYVLRSFQEVHAQTNISLSSARLPTSFQQPQKFGQIFRENCFDKSNRAGNLILETAPLEKFPWGICSKLASFFTFMITFQSTALSYLQKSQNNNKRMRVGWLALWWASARQYIGLYKCLVQIWPDLFI